MRKPEPAPIRRLTINPAWDITEYKLKTYDRGMPVWRNPVVSRGTVYIRRKKEHEGRAVLFTKEAEIRLEWFLKRIPPNVRSGDKIVVAGNLETLNAGEISFIRDALLIPEGYSKMMQDLSEVMARYILSPQTYIGRGEIEHGG